MKTYLEAVKLDLGKTIGRVWWTGRHQCFVPLPLGKNTLGKIPQDAASSLKLENPLGYTFHSLRRTSASCAADQGASSVQLQSHFGWKCPGMAMEYVSKSKAAIRDVAGLLMKEYGDVAFSTPVTVSTPTNTTVSTSATNTVSTPTNASTDTLVTSISSPSRVLNIYGGVFHGAFTGYNA